MPAPRAIAGVMLPAMAGLLLCAALTAAQSTPAPSSAEALIEAESQRIDDVCARLTA